jgi:phage shock protein C
MRRSFTDRVFGGVCGGLAVSLPLSAWFLRVVWLALTVVTLGVAALVYVALWWLLPQESLIRDIRGGFIRFILVLAVVGGVIAAWVGGQNGWLVGPSGQSLWLSVVVVLLGSVFLLRQVRA